MNDIQTVAAKSDITNVGSNLANVACEPRFKPTTPLKFKNISGGNSLSSSQFNQVDNVLSKNQPLTLTLNMEKLYNFGGSTIKSQPIHAITLVGRKYNPSTGKCEYILRNSWGPECDHRYKVRCENGYLYVDGDTLKSITSQADYIE